MRCVIDGCDEAEGQRDERELPAQRSPPSPPLRHMSVFGPVLRRNVRSNLLEGAVHRTYRMTDHWRQVMTISCRGSLRSKGARWE